VDSINGARSFIVQAQESAAALDTIAASLAGSGQLQESVAAVEALSAKLTTSAALLEQALAADAVAVVEGEIFGAPAARTRFGKPRIRTIIGFKRRVRFGTPRKREDA